MAHFETVPFARRCSSCELRAAVVNARAGDEDRPLCEPCARKRVFGQLAKKIDTDVNWWDRERFTWRPDAGGAVESWDTRFETWLLENPALLAEYAVDPDGQKLPNFDEVWVPDDLEQIAQSSKPTGFVGIVYADVNNLGGLLEGLATPVDYSEFAEQVYDATKAAVFSALATHLRPCRVTDQRKRRRLVHPFEILSIGGDDLFLIVPAHVALSVACHVAQDVEKRLRKHRPSYTWEHVQRCRGASPARQCRVSLSAGAVLADAHTPIFYLADLAGQLLKLAKRRAKWLKRARDYYGGTVDFLSLKSVTMLSGSVEQFRQAALKRGQRRLTACPYTVAETDAVLKTIRLLKDADFPRSQLHRLGESLATGRERSTLDYFYFLSRDKSVHQARTRTEQELWMPGDHPWRIPLDEPEDLETIWHDLVELYDFVPGTE